MVAGHVAWTIEGLTVLKPFIQDGRLQPACRSPSPPPDAPSRCPTLPTMAEAGVPGCDFTAWAGIAAPAGTPQPVIGRLYGEMAKILATQEAIQWFKRLASSPAAETPEALPPGARRKRQARRRHSRPGNQGRVGGSMSGQPCG